MTTESFRPADAAELVEIVAASAAAGRSLAVAAGGSKAGLGRPVDAAANVVANIVTLATFHLLRSEFISLAL